MRPKESVQCSVYLMMRKEKRIDGNIKLWVFFPVLRGFMSVCVYGGCNW